MNAEQKYVDLHQAQHPLMLERIVRGNRAWISGKVSRKDWTVPMPRKAWREVERFLEVIRGEPLPLLMLSPDQFGMPECREMMLRLKRILTSGIGIAVLDRLPLDELTVDEAKAVYWVLGQFIATQVAQKWDGTMVYDVTNTGRTPGYGVRASWTDLELFFHTDNAFAIAPPDYVSLLCLHPAKKGGISRFCSLYTVHNEMLKRDPRLLARLYQPVYFDRQAEHAPQDPKVSWAPIFSYDGKRLKVRYSPKLARQGYKLMGETLDGQAEEAFAALDEIISDPKLWIELRIERGQMQYLNNWEVAHFRSTFEDYANAKKKRHLIRLWYRDEGRRFYNG
ncbi:MAG: TauD/TfdA family dioxygenase [SAR324 cluster bacterium]|nr:TauD/TfdA family dioxygenase [SAR324 cluster bacterium]